MILLLALLQTWLKRQRLADPFRKKPKSTSARLLRKYKNIVLALDKLTMDSSRSSSTPDSPAREQYEDVA